VEDIMTASGIAPCTITIDRSRPFDAANFIGPGWTIEEQDERALVLAEVDLNKIRLDTCLNQGEVYITGEQKLRRLKQAGQIRLDAKVFQTLWQNRHSIPESLKELTNGNTTFVCFDGTVLRDPGDNRSVLCLWWQSGEWDWRCSWLDDDWFVDNPSAVLA
jgi:hypothetical protein